MWLPTTAFLSRRNTSEKERDLSSSPLKILYIQAGTRFAFQKKALQNILQFITDILSFLKLF